MPSAPTRRSVLRSSAWAVPAVAVAASSPAFATSPTVPTMSWRFTTQGPLGIEVTVTNPTSAAISASVLFAPSPFAQLSAPAPAVGDWMTGLSIPYTLAPGTSATVTVGVVLSPAPNSNLTLQFVTPGQTPVPFTIPLPAHGLMVEMSSRTDNGVESLAVALRNVGQAPLPVVIRDTYPVVGLDVAVDRLIPADTWTSSWSAPNGIATNTYTATLMAGQSGEVVVRRVPHPGDTVTFTTTVEVIGLPHTMATRTVVAPTGVTSLEVL